MASSVEIKYKGNTIATMSESGQKTLLTQGKYLEGNVLVEATLESGKEVVEWHQCPQLVRDYIDNVTYNPNDYTTSEIANYAPSSPVSTNYKPVGKTIDGATYYNEIPNILTPFATTNKAGTLKPLDALRYIKTDCIDNFRDLGGWSCDGGTVKYGKLFRGTRLVDNTQSKINELLNSLHLGAELDLRNDSEVISYPNTLKDYVNYLHVEGLWYSLDYKDRWKKHIRFIFDCVKENKVIWWHCMGGADRTGTLACVIEGILGVSQSDIDKDYELTSFYSGTYSADAKRARNEQDWIGLITAINAVSGSTFRDKCINFVASLGFTAGEINAFRHAMIDGNPATVTPTITNYTITKNLTLTDIDNSANTIQQGQSYKAKVSAQSGNKLKSVQVSMGGVNITNDDYKTIINGGLDVEAFPYHGEIEIPMVSGNIIITALSQSNARIPAEYQEVAFIGSPHTGTSGTSENEYTVCINPNIKWNEFDKIEFDGLYDNYVTYTGSSGLMVLATYTGQTTRTSPYVAINDSGLKASGVTGTLSPNYTKSQMRQGSFKEITLTLTSHSNTGQVEFGSWSDAGYCMRWRTKEQKWFNGSTLVRHLIPCYRKSDNVIGMYDLVGGGFYSNAGGGILEKGADV